MRSSNLLARELSDVERPSEVAALGLVQSVDLGPEGIVGCVGLEVADGEYRFW